MAGYLIPSPWRALAAMMLCAVVGLGFGVSAGARDAKPRGSAMPAPSGTPLRQSLQAAVLSLPDVLWLSADFDDRPPDGAGQEKALPAEDDPSVEQRERRWGRTEIYRSHLWRPRPREGEEQVPIDIQSEAALYRTVEGAGQAFAARDQEFAALGGQPLDLQVQADQAAAYQLESGPFTLHWVQIRRGNGTGVLVLTSFAGQASLEVTEALARSMAARMR